MKTKSKFYFDVYFNGQILRRFNSLENAQNMIEKIRPKMLTIPEKLFEIRKVKRKSYPQKKTSEKSITYSKVNQKNKKLSTGVQNFALSSDKLCTPYKEEIKQDKELKKKKEKRLSRREIGERSAPETATTFPTFFCGSVKEDKSANAGADSKSVEKAGQKICDVFCFSVLPLPKYCVVKDERIKWQK